MSKKPYHYNSMSPEQRALWDYQNAGQEFLDGGADANLTYEELSPAQIAQLQQSSMSSISTDSKLRDAQLDALRQLEEQTAEGLSARDKAELAKAQNDINRRTKGRTEAIKQNMAARGMSGSGMDLVAQMQASQDATEMDALTSLERSAMAQDNRQNARMNLGQLSGQMRSQDFGEQSAKAQAQDAIARFNTANQVQAQFQNNQGRNQANQANWARDYDYRKDALGVGQGNAQMGYNAAVDAWNREQLKKQQREAKRKGLVSGVLGAAGGVAGAYFGSAAGPMGTMAGASAGYQAGSSLGGAFAHGGRVPGLAPFEGLDTPENDIFAAQLSPGEIVIPKSIANDPVASAQFVAAQNAGMDPLASKYVAQTATQNQQDKVALANNTAFYPTPNGKPIPEAKPSQPIKANKPAPISEPILKQLEATRPDLVAQYRERMKAADSGVKDAETMQSYMGLANLAGKAFTDFSNSQQNDVILKNRMQDLGSAPQVARAERKDYDSSALDKLGALGVANAKDKRQEVRQGFDDEQKLQAIDQAERLKDPNSDESKSARAFLTSIIPNAANNQAISKMSAAQLEKASPVLMEKWKADRAQINADRELGLKEKELGIKVAGKKQLNGEEQKRYDHSAMTLTGVRDMRDALANGDNTFSVVGDNDFTKAARRAAEAFGRAQSGGAINKDEEARFMNMLPTKWDSAEMQQKKLNDIEREVSARILEMGRDPEAAYASRASNPSATVKKPDWAR